jgi:hypothetical protein
MALLSFFDKNVYCYVTEKLDRSFVYKYLLFILAISSIPAFYIINTNIYDYINGPGKNVIQQIPEVYIKDGKISTEVSLPYIINDPETDKELIIIDNTGSFSSIEGNNAFIILVDGQLQVRTYENTAQNFDLTEFGDFKINKLKVKESIPIVKWVIIIMYILYTLFLFTFYFILIHIYAWSGGFLDHFARSGLNYQAILRISALAITPVLLIDTILKIMMIHIPHWGIVSIILSMSLIYFGLISNKNKEQSTNSSNSRNQTD